MSLKVVIEATGRFNPLFRAILSVMVPVAVLGKVTELRATSERLEPELLGTPKALRAASPIVPEELTGLFSPWLKLVASAKEATELAWIAGGLSPRNAWKLFPGRGTA